MFCNICQTEINNPFPHNCLSIGVKLTEEDPINPIHYKNHPSGIECIEITRHMNFNLGSAMKYLWRVDSKDDPITNLEKAVWYINDEIKLRKKELK